MITVTILTVLLVLALLAVLILVLQLRTVNEEANELSDHYNNTADPAYKFQQEGRLKDEVPRDVDYWHTQYGRSELENKLVS